MNKVDKAGIDLREVARKVLGQDGKRSGAYVQFSAPDREDSDPSLTVWANCFKDWGAPDKRGDVFDFLKIYGGMDYRAALVWLGEPQDRPLGHSGRAVARPYEQPEAPGMEWQEKAWEVIRVAERNLWEEPHPSPPRTQGDNRAMRYLMEERGLSPETIREARLGYVPGGYKEWKNIGGLNVPCGILIPWIIGGEVWQLKVRRAAGSPKYMQVKGGKSGGVYNIDKVQAGWGALIDEGEFNVLAFNQMQGFITGVALGSASNPLTLVGIEKLLVAKKIWVRMDDDRAGQQAKMKLLAMSRRIREAPELEGDINEVWVNDRELFWKWYWRMAKCI